MPSVYSEFRGSRWYRVPKTKLVLGPFTGGINKTTDPTRLAANELQECINYIINPDGRLVGRPHVTSPMAGLVGFQNLIGQSINMTIIPGTHTRTTTVVPVGVGDNGTNLLIYRYNVATNNWTTIFGTGFPTGFSATQMFSYNNVSYFMVYDSSASTDKLYKSTGSAPTRVAAFDTLVTSALGAGAPVWNKQAFIIKDRMVVAGDGIILWSKATDPTVWAVPDGGYVKYPGDASGSVVLYRDALYIFGTDGAWRFTWTTDPSIDGVLEQVSTAPFLGSVVFNEELYVATTIGLYKFNNGYLVELSQKIALDYERRVSAAGSSAAAQLTLLDHYLLVGPFVDVANYESYYVYDLKLGVWFNWQFKSSAGIHGPQPNIFVQGLGTTNGILKYVWSSTSSVYFTDINEVITRTTPVGYDVDTNGNSVWIGYKLVTALVNLGSGVSFKRIFRSLLEATFNAVAFSSGSSTISLLIDNTVNNLVVENNLLSWGKSYRGIKAGFSYDSTGANVAVGSTPAVELTDIDRIHMYVAASREVTT